MYASIDEYQVLTFLKAWEKDHRGENGPLVISRFDDLSGHCGHPDDALGRFSTSKLSS